MKKLYSLNLITYLRMKGYVQDSIEMDKENGKVYYSFPQGNDIEKAIAEYKNPNVEVNLRYYIAVFKTVRQEIKEIRD